MEQIINKLKELTGHSFIKLTDSGDSAIFVALHIAKVRGKTKVLIPDQAGWLTYRTYPQVIGLETKEVKTNYGIIDVEDLNKKADKHSVLIIPSLAGYFAEQPISDLASICQEKGCMLVVDICGSIGMSGFNTDKADLVVCSFGKWKPLNLEYGGFIAANNQELFNIDDELIKEFKFAESYEQELLEKLSGLNDRVDFLTETSEKIKKELQGFEIIHKNKRGINVVVKYSDETEKQKLIKYCNENNYEFTKCPRYIRVLDNAISIEVKRLEVV